MGAGARRHARTEPTPDPGSQSIISHRNSLKTKLEMNNEGDGTGEVGENPL